MIEPPPADDDTPAARPASVAALFVAFTGLALQGFGGVLGVVHRELVERRGWLTERGFLADWALAQVLPGPNVCNLALMVGGRAFGWRGALAALAGLLVAPCLLLVALASVVDLALAQPAVQGALRGMGAVAVGIVAGAALKLARTLRTHPLGPWAAGALAALALAALVGARVPLLAVVAVVGGVSCAATAWRLHASGRPAAGDASSTGGQ